MRKTEFLYALRRELAGLPQNDIEERISFYSEMIDDRIEEGVSEEEVIEGIGSPESVAAQIKADFMPQIKEVKPPKAKHKWSAWEIILLIFALPFLISVAASVLSAVVSIYVSIWSVVISLWACVVSLWGFTLGGLTTGIGMMVTGSTFPGLALIAAAIFSAGLSIFVFFAAHLAGKWTVILTKKLFVWLKGKLTRGEVE